MSLLTSSNRKDHVGNGVSQDFTYDFLVLAEADLKVFVSDVQVLSGITINGVGNPAGGSVHFDVAPADQAPVALLRDVDYTQPIQYPVGNKFPSATHERALDRLTMLTQQLKEILGRALRFKTTSLLKDIIFPEGTNAADRAGKVARWDATGAFLELVNVSTLGAFPNPLLAKGDLLAAGASAVPMRLPIGTDGQYLIADSTQAVSMKWSGNLLALNNGSESTPSLGFATGANNGFFLPFTNEVALALNGAARYLFAGANFRLGKDIAFGWHDSASPVNGTFDNQIARVGAGLLKLTSDGTALGHMRMQGYPTQTFRNLRLQTHPDQDQWLTKVQMTGADEIVFDDGVRVSNLGPLTADITVSGAGGLDTPAEAASTWYEIFIIRKSVDGTKNLLLHRMKDYLKSSQGNDDANVGLRVATSTLTDLLAQGFQVSTTGLVEMVSMKLQKQNAPTGQIWVEIRTDSAGDPSSTILATSDKVDVVGIDASAARVVRFIFRTPVTLSTATQYHLVLNGNYTRSDTINILARFKGTTNPYASGSFRQFNGAAWSAVNADANADAFFELWTTRNDAAVTMPSGYDQKCKLGQVFNDGGSNFVPFLQRDYWVKQGASETTPTGSGVAAVSNVADQTNTEDLYAGSSQGARIPWNAVKALLGVEAGYSTNPAAAAAVQCNIKPLSSNNDINRCSANSVGTSAWIAMIHTWLSFQSPNTQAFRWQLLSTDSGTANKTVIIDLHGYEWA